MPFELVRLEKIEFVPRMRLKIDRRVRIFPSYLYVGGTSEEKMREANMLTSRPSEMLRFTGPIESRFSPNFCPFSVPHV